MDKEEKTYHELLVARDHARDICFNMKLGADRKAIANALDYLCQCQQRLEERECQHLSRRFNERVS